MVEELLFIPNFDRQQCLKKKSGHILVFPAKKHLKTVEITTKLLLEGPKGTYSMLHLVEITSRMFLEGLIGTYKE